VANKAGKRPLEIWKRPLEILIPIAEGARDAARPAADEKARGSARAAEAEAEAADEKAMGSARTAEAEAEAADEKARGSARAAEAEAGDRITACT